jgi:hypothetical protein
LAFRFSIPDDTNPATAAEVVAAWQNSLLVIAGIAVSSCLVPSEIPAV